LRHGPAGVPAVDQRSCLVAPLVAQNALLGCVYADLGARSAASARPTATC
jgi:hypothetical protein